MKKTKLLALALAAAAVLGGCQSTDQKPGGGNVSLPQSSEKSSSADKTSSESSSKNESSSESSSAGEDASSADSSSESSAAQSSTQSANTNQDPIGGEMSGSILVLNDGRGIVLYGGSKSVGKHYAETLNKFQTALDGVNVYSLVAPTAGSFYLPAKYSNYMASEWDNIENINSYFNGVKPVDAYTALQAHKSEHIYSKTDHHWQPLGAYYAAEEFAKVAGVPFAALSQYETVARDGYVGTLYGYSDENEKIKNNPETFTYYIPKNNYTTTFYNDSVTSGYEGNLLLNIDNLSPVSWYLVFIGTDDIVTHVETDCKNGRTLMIIKDSYGNALLPCLTSSFENIWMVDMRYFTGSAVELAKDKGVTDLLFVMNTFSATGGNESYLEGLL